MKDTFKFPPLDLLKNQDNGIDCDVLEHNRRIMYLREVLESEKFWNFNGKLPIALGVDESDNEFVIESLRSISNLLIGGTSRIEIAAFLKCIILSLLYSQTPDDLRLLLIDSTGVELNVYNKISRQYFVGIDVYDRHVISSAFESVGILESLIEEMERRYDLFSEMQIRNIDEYNEKVASKESLHTERHTHLPYLVVIIYEIKDLKVSCGRKFETPLCWLSQKGRAAGIHLIVVTQHPDIHIITGLVKINFANRVSFRLLSKDDSRTLLDQSGAELLSGQEDMLYNKSGEIRRLHCFRALDDEKRVCEWIASNNEEYVQYALPDVLDKQSDVLNKRRAIEVMEQLMSFIKKN